MCIEGKNFAHGWEKNIDKLFGYLFLLIVLGSKAVLVLSGSGLLNNIRGFSTIRCWTLDF